MKVDSYQKEMNRTCRRCYTILDFRRDFCCAKSKTECFADIGLVGKGMRQDKALRLRLYRKRRMDAAGKITDRKFFRGVFRDECLVFDYRPPGCRSHFCYRWDKYIEEHPEDMVMANLDVVPTAAMLKALRREYEFGMRLAHPGGIIIFTDHPNKVKKELKALFDDMGIKCFFTDASLMDPEDNSKPGIEVIMDRDGIFGEPGLFGTIINNNMFMLVRMKMNLGSSGFEHSNIAVTTMDPMDIAKESPASLKSFHAMKAFRV